MKNSENFVSKKPSLVNKTGDIELISQNTINLKTSLESPLLPKNNSSEKTPGQNYLNIGYLIPLSCGHNGDLRPLEVDVFEHYLKNARLTNSDKNV